jgi:hypothetical protein
VTRVDRCWCRLRGAALVRLVARDEYADLPPARSFELSSSTVAHGVTRPLAQRSGIFGAGGQDQQPAPEPLSVTEFND